MWRDVLQALHIRCLITAERSKGGRNKEPLQMQDHPHVGQNQKYASQGPSSAFRKSPIKGNSHD